MQGAIDQPRILQEFQVGFKYLGLNGTASRCLKGFNLATRLIQCGMELEPLQ
jgi:hypothetical protein